MLDSVRAETASLSRDELAAIAQAYISSAEEVIERRGQAAGSDG